MASRAGTDGIRSDPGRVSSVGAKALMALTGIALLAFVVGHLQGNLRVFAGPEALNAYAHSLRESPLLLWGARVVLLAALVVHVACAWILRRRNRRARPVPYAVWRPMASSYASRTMMMSGLIVLAFTLYHLAHFTFGWVPTERFGELDERGRLDVYAMVVTGFGHPLVVAIYLAAQVLLALHIWHGFQSLFQSLGLSHPRIDRPLRLLSPLLAGAIFVGYASIPVVVQLGLLRAPAPAASPRVALEEAP